MCGRQCCPFHRRFKLVGEGGTIAIAVAVVITKNVRIAFRISADFEGDIYGGEKVLGQSTVKLDRFEEGVFNAVGIDVAEKVASGLGGFHHGWELFDMTDTLKNRGGHFTGADDRKR
jgi:hypothetical protein